MCATPNMTGSYAVSSSSFWAC